MSVYAVAITGGSGAPYALRLLQVLLAAGHEVHVCISVAGETVLQVESGVKLGKTLREKAAALTTAVETDHGERLRLFDPMNLAAPISSGSFPCAGMAIIPCSTGTLGRIANGISSNLIERAADVMLKERRRLIVVRAKHRSAIFTCATCSRFARRERTSCPPCRRSTTSPGTSRTSST
jgi:4-hydroxy-3-polyprenylbenzoate decarboxylase